MLLRTRPLRSDAGFIEKLDKDKQFENATEAFGKYCEN
jgi:hypothetical protein